MKMTLTKKIIGPFALIGLLVIGMIAVMFVLDSKRETAATSERAVLDAMAGLNKVSDLVKTGILTRKESIAIDTAKVALGVDADLNSLGPTGQALKQQFQDYFAAVVAINSIYLENRTAEGEKRLDQLRERGVLIDQAVKARLDDIAGERSRLSAFARTFQIAVLIVMIAALVFVTLFVTHSVVQPVAEMRRLIQDIAQGEGDLTARLKRTSSDEIGDIADAFNTMTAKLQEIMRFVINASRDVAQSADALAVAMEQSTRATQRQSEAAAATATAVEEVTVSIAQVADHSREAELIVVEADKFANAGQATAALSARQVAATAEAVGRAASQVNALSERSEQIRSIVGVIREIADQTNLLALNAAIEAARAGEQGRGFAVVADEVRKLAERTTASTSEIAGMIDTIGRDISKAVEMIREGSSLESEGVATAENLKKVLEQISQSVDRSTQRTRDIAAATREQASAAETVAQNVERIAQMSEEINLASSQSSRSANAMRDLASRLMQHVGHFKV
jgi:methyl-accepting chemotaxis protein